ncbi:pentapeptide repeat-containing protein [Microbacterium sp.]|uniref:pentapeptide repeat-containing protein n=1 Tax=Microbacterium sp. TaxID=51671 RepID=UPI00281104AD|nr:pentapeptide repeat-containing protein [Microbacterium sp.]
MARSPESPVPPRVTRPDLPDTLAAAVPSRRADLLAARLVLDGEADLAYASLEQCVITADAGTVDLTGATLLDVAMTDVRLASLVLRGASIRRLRISGGRIGTLDLSGSRIAELDLRDVRIDYLTLSGARVDDAEVTGCSIRTLDMPQAELTRVRFTSATADEVDPRGMRAADVDLRGLDALAFLDANSLRGTTLTPFQVQQLAPTIAAGLGILIKD